MTLEKMIFRSVFCLLFIIKGRCQLKKMFNVLNSVQSVLTAILFFSSVIVKFACWHWITDVLLAAFPILHFGHVLAVGWCHTFVGTHRESPTGQRQRKEECGSGGDEDKRLLMMSELVTSQWIVEGCWKNKVKQKKEREQIVCREFWMFWFHIAQSSDKKNDPTNM